MRSLGVIVNKTDDLGFVLTDFPDNLSSIKPDCEISIGFNEKFTTKFTIIKSKILKRKVNIWLKEYNNETQFKDFLEKKVFIDDSYLSFKKTDGYFISELIGCKVINIETDKSIGEIIDVLILPANDVWLIRTEVGDLPIPVINDVVKNVNIKEKLVKIKLIDGLMDLISNEVEDIDED